MTINLSFIFFILILGQIGINAQDHEYTEEHPIHWDFSTCFMHQNSTLYFTNDQETIQRINLNELSRRNSFELFFDYKLQMNDSIKTMTFDSQRQKLLAVSKESHKLVYEIDANKQVQLLNYKNDRQINELAVDYVTGNIYFAKTGHGIGVCNNNMSLCEILISAKLNTEEVLNLIVHPRRGALLWLQTDGSFLRVKMSGMNGKNPRNFADLYSHAIALDASNPQQEYLYAALHDTVVKYNLQTMTRETFLSHRAEKLFYFDCFLFYTQNEQIEDHGTKYYFSYYNFWTEHTVPLIETDTSMNLDFIFTAGHQMNLETSNPCIQSNCSEDEICVLVEKVKGQTELFKCIAAQSMQPTIKKKQQIESNNSQSGWSIGEILSIILVIIVFILLGYIFRKKILEIWRKNCPKCLSKSNSHQSNIQNSLIVYNAAKSDSISSVISNNNKEFETDSGLSSVNIA